MFGNRTQTVLVLSLGVFVASLGVLALLFYGIATKKETIEARAAAWATADEKQEQLAALATLVEETRGDREQLASYLVTDESVIDFLSELEGTARDMGLAIETKSLSVEPIESRTDFETLAVSVDIIGPQETVATMVRLIETLPYQVALPRATLGRIETLENGREVWRASVDLRVTKRATP